MGTDNTARHAISEVVATLDGLAEYLRALQKRLQQENPALERTRTKLVETSQAIKWDLDEEAEDDPVRELESESAKNL